MVLKPETQEREDKHRKYARQDFVLDLDFEIEPEDDLDLSSFTTTDRNQEPNQQDQPVQGPDQVPTLWEHPRINRINNPRLIGGTYLLPRPITTWILPPQEVFEYDFFEWKAYPSPKNNFLSQFPVLYQAQ
jgi:hypothetical protein